MDLMMRIALQFIIAVPFLIVLIFIPAGTVHWINGWVYFGLQVTFSSLMTLYLVRNDPELLKKRLEAKIPPKLWDKLVMLPFVIASFALIIVSGLDYRYSWSDVSNFMQILGGIGVVMSFYFLYLVMKQNSYLLKTVEIQKNQKVVTTGPYEVVRHPMYSAVVIMMFSIALLLESLYGLLPAAIASLSIAIRAQFEDNMLQKELKGYRAYTKKTRYKLIPYIW